MKGADSSSSLRHTALQNSSSTTSLTSKASTGKGSSWLVRKASYLTGSGGYGFSKNISLLVEGPGLTGSVGANNHQDVVSEEAGDWQYLVVDPAGIRPREDPVYDKKGKKSGDNRIKEGSVCMVDRRRTAGWTTWLSLKNGDGWLFDVSPKDKKVRLVEVEVATGSWRYECVADRVPILPKPQMNFAGGKSLLKAQVFLTNKEVVHVAERVRPLNGKGSFLRLADGRGWAVDFVDGQQVLQRQLMAGESPGPSANGYVQSSPPKPGFVNVRPLAASGNLFALESDPLPGVGTNLEESQLGEWDYIVVDPKGISLRSNPTYDQNYKLNKRIEEGEVVVVHERVPGDGTLFLRLASPSGWCFEQTPSRASKKVQKLRMQEIQVDKGLWYYAVIAERGVALRSRCTFSESSKISKGPVKGVLCEVTERVRAGESTFMKMKDGSGWIFDIKNHKRILEGPIQMQVLPPNSVATVNGQDEKGGGGIHLRSSPTKLSHALTKFYIINGAKVRASMICEVESTRWVFVSKREGGGGVEGWALADVLHLDLPLEVPNDRLSPKAPTEAPAILGTALSRDRLPPSQAWGSTKRNGVETFETETPIEKASLAPTLPKGSAKESLVAADQAWGSIKRNGVETFETPNEKGMQPKSTSTGYVACGFTGSMKSDRLESNVVSTTVSVASAKSFAEATSIESFAEGPQPPVVIEVGASKDIFRQGALPLAPPSLASNATAPWPISGGRHEGWSPPESQATAATATTCFLR